MSGTAHLRPSDLRGLSRIAIDAVIGVTDLVEALHHGIARASPPLGKPPSGRTGGITGFVYGAVRGITGLVGSGLDAALARLVPLLPGKPSSREREAVLSALNGVLGDHLFRTESPLAITMRFRHEGKALPMARVALRAAFPDAGPHIVVFVHGLCMNDLQWNWKGHDHGDAISRVPGVTPVHLHYNSGRHISQNGRELAAALEELVREWPVPVEKLSLVGFSMGGLVARSACHYGAATSREWPRKLDSLFFLGTPHHGAPLERGGSMVDLVLSSSPYAAPFARLARIRSAGITDLRHGAIRDEDWDGRDRFARHPEPEIAVPLPAGARCYALAATTGDRAGSLVDRLAGDGLVPLASALGRHRTKGRDLGIAPSHQWVGVRMSHLDLLGSAEAGERMRAWLEAG